MDDLTHRSPRALITTTTPWPLSARLAMSLTAHGCRVAALCPKRHALHTLKRLERIYSYSLFRPLDSLAAAIAECQPDLIVPCDDRAVWQLHALHHQAPALRPLIERSIGSPTHYPVVRSRFQFHELATSLGLHAPLSRPVHSAADLRDWFTKNSAAAVLKKDGSYGGNGIRIVHDLESATDAFKALSTKPSYARAWKRWLVNHDPVAFCGATHAGPDGICIQEFVDGEPVTLMAACYQGELLGTVTAEVLAAQGSTGASTIIRVIRSEAMEEAARRIAKALQLSGFFGLDFLLEQARRRALIIELNPRCTQLGHLPLHERGDLAGSLCARLGAAAGTTGTGIKQDLIAFFPQAFAFSDDSTYLPACHHDVPWAEPDLIRELLRGSWEERHWRARWYNRLSGAPRSPLPVRATLLRLIPALGSYLGDLQPVTDVGGALGPIPHHAAAEKVPWGDLGVVAANSTRELVPEANLGDD